MNFFTRKPKVRFILTSPKNYQPEENKLQNLNCTSSQVKQLTLLQKISTICRNSRKQSPKTHQQCINLKQLHTANTEICFKDVQYIIKIKTLTTFSTLLSKNQKDKSLSTILQNLDQLESFDIRNDNLTDADIYKIASSLKKLQRLVLRSTQMSIQSMKHIHVLLPDIKILNLKGTKIGNDSCNFIILNFPQLTGLNFSQCGLQNEGLIMLNDNLRKLKNLAITRNNYNIMTNLYLRNLDQLQFLDQSSFQYFGQKIMKKLFLSLRSLKYFVAQSVDFKLLPKRFMKNIRYISKIQRMPVR